MQSEDGGTIQRARPCTSCGYNLYARPREGTCPECGHAYKPRQSDTSPKNPHRQLPQLRRLQRKRRKNLDYGVPAYWMITASAFGACYWFEAATIWWLLSFAAFVATALEHLDTVCDLRSVEEKIEAVDEPEQGE